MAGTKEIRLKIKSVQNTRKITKAMEMVAASKMKKAQERMRAGRPYARRILAIAMHAAHANAEYKHPLLTRRPDVKRVGAVVITVDGEPMNELVDATTGVLVTAARTGTLGLARSFHVAPAAVEQAVEQFHLPFVQRHARPALPEARFDQHGIQRGLCAGDGAPERVEEP